MLQHNRILTAMAVLLPLSPSLSLLPTLPTSLLSASEVS